MDLEPHPTTLRASPARHSLIVNGILTTSQWNAAVTLLPLWLAPNMVTLLGFFCILFNVLLLQIFVPDLYGPAPAWLCYSFAAGLWLYSTMDNIDGKQARRTGTSSGLGELFDHGIDSLNCTLGSLLETTAMGLGPTKIGAFTALVPCLPMFFSTWETYHTHTLFLGAFNGPTEGLILACTSMIISGYFGSDIWQYRLADYFGFDRYLGDAVFLDFWLPIVLGAFFFAHLPSCIINVYHARKSQNLPMWPVFSRMDTHDSIHCLGLRMVWLTLLYTIAGKSPGHFLPDTVIHFWSAHDKDYPAPLDSSVISVLHSCTSTTGCWRDLGLATSLRARSSSSPV